jgi:dTDP-4-amino-4,6-dideoxygalactose transaminase
MEVLDTHIALRRRMHDFYSDIFQSHEGVRVFQEPSSDYFCNFWLSAILVDPTQCQGKNREDLRLALEAANIESRPLWKPMHLQPVFASAPYYGRTVAERLFDDGLCLPSGSNLTDNDCERIARIINSF